jgi:uncharacterized membrane protein YedE/YeeE
MVNKKTTPRKAAQKSLRVSKPRVSSRSNVISKASPSPAGGNFLVFLLFGILFGYFLSKSRATDYDTVIDMFQFHDLQLYGVIAVAIAVIALGLFLFRRWGVLPALKNNPEWQKMNWEPNRLVGAFVFGAGWVVTGTCPGTALTQIGEGKIVALFTVLGILIGVFAFKKFKPGSNSNDQVC